MSDQDVQSIIDRVSKSIEKKMDERLVDHAKTVNANIQNTVSRKFDELAEQIKMLKPLTDAVTEPSWFAKFKQTVTEQYDGVSRKVETLWAAHPPIAEVPKIAQVSVTTEKSNWLVRLWLSVKNSVVSVARYLQDGAKRLYSWAKGRFNSSPTLIYLGVCIPAAIVMMAFPFTGVLLTGSLLTGVLSAAYLGHAEDLESKRKALTQSVGAAGNKDEIPSSAEILIKRILATCGLIASVSTFAGMVIDVMALAASKLSEAIVSRWPSMAPPSTELAVYVA